MWGGAPQIKLQAAVFDLKRTLVDDIAFHYQAWKALGDRVGPALIEALGREREEMYRSLYRPHLA